MSDSDEWVGFWIGGEDARRLEVTYLGATGIPEEGWHRFLVEASVMGFTARFECETQLVVLAAFRDEVLAMYETLRGAAVMTFMEEGLCVRGQMIDPYGHVLWRIELHHPLGDSSKLSFEIGEDQTMLWNLVAKIDSLLEVANYRMSP